MKAIDAGGDDGGDDDGILLFFSFGTLSARVHCAANLNAGTGSDVSAISPPVSPKSHLQGGSNSSSPSSIG